MEQNRNIRNKPTPIWSINICKASKNIQWGKDSLFKHHVRKQAVHSWWVAVILVTS